MRFKIAGQKIYILLAILFFLVAIPWTTLVFDEYASNSIEAVRHAADSLSNMLIMLSVSIGCIAIGMEHLCINEKGVVLNGGEIIRWSQIVSYEWEGSKNNHLKIFLNTRLPFFRSRSIAIDLDDKEAVNRVMRERVPYHNAAPQPTPEAAQ